MPRTDRIDVEARELVRWRVTRLRRAGLADPAARRIAADPGYDIHVLLDLIDRGCPPVTAVRIVAPLHSAPMP